MVSIATCESGLNPSAYNAAGYHGLFQYDQTTWAAYGYGSIYDPVAQARTTAELLAAGESSAAGPTAHKKWPASSGEEGRPLVGDDCRLIYNLRPVDPACLQPI